MKVVNLSTTDMGGAYEAAQRISDCLVMYGVKSDVVVRTKFREQTPVVPFYHNLPQKLLSKTKNFFNLIISKGEVVFDKYGADICKHPLVKEADIICLHWVNSFISNKEVENILAMGKPVFWVMHDMWPFTGGCHYAWDCENYKTECRKCPMTGAAAKEEAFYWQSVKKSSFQRKNLVPIGPSRWISDCARQSRIFGDKDVVTIPNPIDTDVFIPKNSNQKKEIRKRYGLPDDKMIILFAAAKVTNNPIKGFSYFADAVNMLPAEQYEILVLGKSDGEDVLRQKINLRIHYAGFVDQAEQLRDIYNAADLLVAPSLQENYSNTVLESLSCGTPVVAFHVGGMGELVETGVNGFLSGPKDTRDLYHGIISVAKNREALGEAARERVIRRNAFSVISEQYISIFNELLLEKEEQSRV